MRNIHGAFGAKTKSGSYNKLLTIKLRVRMASVFTASLQSAVPVHNSPNTYPVRRIYCVGRNYAEHAREMGFDPDREPPFFFCKPADSIVNVPHGATVDLPYPSLTKNFHYEMELVVAIGKQGKNISEEEANDYIWGYACGLDMTRRDLQIGMREKGRPWEIGKAFDHGAPIGPLYPKSETGIIDKGAIWLKVNGQSKQSSDVEKLIWNIPETIANLSTYFELFPGDLIYTGTPEGVGAVKVGDVMEGGIAGLGEIKLRVV
jgi:fumarylpyruvate hydrolase